MPKVQKPAAKTQAPVAKVQQPAAKPRSRADLWICLLLLAATFAVYAQSRQFAFLNYDDPDYVTNNPHVRQGITADGALWALTSTEAANWFPLTRLSHMLDVQLFGMDAGWHHLVSVLIHAAASVLLFLFLARATGARGPSAFVAFVFALHPLHVESVAWVAERKDVLCAFFWFLALWAYVRGMRTLVIVAFVLGLMSKPMIVTLPFTLLLLDIWPLKRGLRVKEKLPLFAIAAAGAVVTYVVQRAGGAVNPAAMFGPGNALVSYLVYIAKTFWPAGLAVFYPYPEKLSFWLVAPAALALAAISWGAIRLHRRYPYLAVGWFWFLATLVPVIGIVRAGEQARADRYMYVPMIGLAVMIAWGGADLLRKWPRLRVAVATAACVACAGGAWAQAGYWRNSETLFSHALEVTRGNYIAEHNLGTYLTAQPGRLPEAVTHLEQAVRLRPDMAQVHSDLGIALAGTPGRLEGAIAEFRTAARLRPDSPVPHFNLGNALAQGGRLKEAAAEYETALRIQPDAAGVRDRLTRVTADMHYQAAIALTKAGHSREAAAEFETARQLDPAHSAAHKDVDLTLSKMHYQAGIALAREGHPREAAAEFETALQFDPDFAEAHNNLGVVLSQMPGKENEAINHFREALRIRPDYQDASNNLQSMIEERRAPGR
ncbi:MAG: tetratricopeptide repeat protein [Bryobacteraceae bacterium]